MRRKDRALSQDEAYEIIDNSIFATLSCINPNTNEIFTIPISTARLQNSIFIHGATTGTKAEIFSDNLPVSFVFVSYAQVPKLSNADFMEISNDATKLGSRVFTTEYKSVIAQTKVQKITQNHAKLKALRLLCEKYTPNCLSAFQTAALNALEKINIYEFKIETLTAKAKILN